MAPCTFTLNAPRCGRNNDIHFCGEGLRMKKIFFKGVCQKGQFTIKYTHAKKNACIYVSLAGKIMIFNYVKTCRNLENKIACCIGT